ncbi:MAG: TRAP transporter substrate-binding protein DctP [Myxococcota bacterium]|nr:TRAP transporter substrate-binding protein DctP [Myxococcota bacterium]
MKKTWIKAAGVSAVALAVLATPTSETQAQAQYTLNFGTVAPEGTPWADQLQSFRKRIQDDSNGAIKVVVHHGTMGGEIEMSRDCRRGERLQGVGVSTGALSEGAGVPLLQLPELPYLFRNEAEADAVLDEVLYEPVAKQLDAKGFVFNTWAENGWRNFATKGGPATTPEELAKFKMRSQESMVHTGMYKALGTQAVALPTSEVLQSLNTGVVTGFDNTPLFSLAAGWINPVTHYTLSRHIYQPAAIVYSKRFMARLSPDLQKVVEGDPAKEASIGRKAVRAQEGDMLAVIKTKGIEIVDLSDAQRQAFAAKTQGVHMDFVAANPGVKGEYEKTMAKLKAMR